MTDERFQSIEKPFGTRIVELMQSLQVLRDSISAVRAGKPYQMIPIYGQMRALLTDRASNNKPLLFYIAEKLGVGLQMYAMPTAGESPLPAGLSDKLVEHFAGMPVGLHQSLPRQSLVEMADFLDKPLYLRKDRTHTPRALIQLLATKAGGAHYAGRITNEESELLYSNWISSQVLHTSLLQLAEVTLALGQRMLRRLCKFDLHLIIFAPQQNIDKPRFILDCSYPDNPSRFCLVFLPGMRLSFRAIGLDGMETGLTVPRTITWPGTHHVWMSVDLLDDLHTSLKISVDAEEAASVVLPFPLFISNDLPATDTYWNRSHEDANGGATFGLCEFAAFGGEMSALSSAQMLVYFDESLKTKGKFVFYTPGAFGYSPPGVKDITHTGPVVMRTIESLRKEYGMTDDPM